MAFKGNEQHALSGGRAPSNGSGYGWTPSGNRACQPTTAPHRNISVNGSWQSREREMRRDTQSDMGKNSISKLLCVHRGSSASVGFFSNVAIPVS